LEYTGVKENWVLLEMTFLWKERNLIFSWKQCWVKKKKTVPAWPLIKTCSCEHTHTAKDSVVQSENSLYHLEQDSG